MSPLTWQQRDVLAVAYPLAHVSPADWTVGDPGPPFAPGILSDFGNYGLPADGIDSIIASLFSDLPTDIAAIGGLEGLLGGLDFVAGQLAATTIDPVATDHATYTGGITPAVDAWTENAATWSALPTRPLPSAGGRPPEAPLKPTIPKGGDI